MLNGIDSVVLGVDDLPAARRFYKDFGLAEADAGGGHASFRTLDASTLHLRSSRDPGLPPAVCDGPTIREIAWAVDDAADIELIGANLSADRDVQIDGDGALRATDEDGYGISFRIDGRKEFSPPQNRTNIFGALPNRPINSTIDFHEAVKPASLAHVVIFSPDVARAERFYVERLGFRVSDRFRQAKGVFLRAPGSAYHHTLFILHAPQAGLHHIAFHVRDFTDVMNGGMSLLKSGWAPKFGPGRHILGANYFWYFDSPCGGAMELTADMDRVDDSWTPRVLDLAPENTAAWTMSVSRPAQ